MVFKLSYLFFYLFLYWNSNSHMYIFQGETVTKVNYVVTNGYWKPQEWETSSEERMNVWYLQIISNTAGRHLVVVIDVFLFYYILYLIKLGIKLENVKAIVKLGN